MNESNPKTEPEELEKRSKRKRNHLKAKLEKPNSIVGKDVILTADREDFGEAVGDEKRKKTDREEEEEKKSEKHLSDGDGGEDGEEIDDEDEEEKEDEQVRVGWGIMSTAAFSSLPLSGLTMKAIIEMKFQNMTQVVLIRAFDCSVIGFRVCLPWRYLNRFSESW